MDAYSDFLSDYHLYVENSKVQTVRAIEQRADMLHKMVEQYRQSLIDKIMPPVIEVCTYSFYIFLNSIFAIWTVLL